MSDLKIGEKIKANRKAQNLTQEELAAILGVSKAAVSKWENAESYPDIEMLPKIAGLFHITIDTLFDYTVPNFRKLVDRLKALGIAFSEGLSQNEIKEIERTFGFRFPKEIAYFLSLAYPVEPNFFNYRDMSEHNLQVFHDFEEKIKQSFWFDLQNNTPTLEALLRRLGCKNTLSFGDAVMDALFKSPRLIPFYQNRCFLDGIDGTPIISFHQPVDTIIYGSDLENYFENEFLSPKNFHIVKRPDQMEDMGIWYYLTE